MTKSMTIEELWEYLPEEFICLVRSKKGSVFACTQIPSLTSIGWSDGCGDIEKIIFKITGLHEDWEQSLVERPVDYSKYVGRLCWFWDDNKQFTHIGKLIGIKSVRSHQFAKDGLGRWRHCQPLTSQEIENFLNKAKEVGL